MAIVITTTDWDATGVLKQGSYQALTVSKQKTKVFNIAFECADVYATGGMTLDLSDGGRIGTITYVTVSQMSDITLVPTYTASACSVASTGKIQFTTPVCCTCVISLTEIAACSAAIQCVSFKVHVIGTAN